MALAGHESCDDSRIRAIGLPAQAQALRVIVDPARVDHVHDVPMPDQRVRENAVQLSGGLHTDAASGRQLPSKSRGSLHVILDTAVAQGSMNVDLVLRHVTPHYVVHYGLRWRSL